MKTIIIKISQLKQFIKTSYQQLKARYYNRKIQKDFKGFLDLIKPTVEEKYFAVYEKVLSNALIYYRNCNDSPQTQKHPFSLHFYLTLTKEVLDKLLEARHVVGIQPMSGPVGLVYKLQYKHEPTPDNQEDNTFEGRRVSLEVISNAVEAGSRKLRAGWTIEAMQDMSTVHNLDIEGELIKCLSAEIAHELITEIVSDLHKLASKNETIEVVQPTDETPFIRDRLQSLFVSITKASSSIAHKTRRGCGNFIVTTPLGVSLLQSFPHFKFVEKVANGKSHNGALCYMGDLVDNNGGVIYKILSTLVSPLSEDDKNVYFLVGYKGGNGEVDTPYILSPYVPVMSAGIVVNPVTFQPVVGLMTRYGKHVTMHSADTSPLPMSTAQNYYRLVKFNTDELFHNPVV